jgi:hypothetical protein
VINLIGKVIKIPFSFSGRIWKKSSLSLGLQPLSLSFPKSSFYPSFNQANKKKPSRKSIFRPFRYSGIFNLQPAVQSPYSSRSGAVFSSKFGLSF